MEYPSTLIEKGKLYDELKDSHQELIESLTNIVELWNDPDNPSGAWDHAVHAIAKGAIEKAKQL